MDHLLALKHYLMLGYGDFADHLMEALGLVCSLLQPRLLLTFVTY
jgi:hypothetical protein